MEIKVLGAFGGDGVGQRPSAFLVDGRVLVDAGTVGGGLSIPEQLAIEHVLISHSHLDHVAGLASLTDNLACGSSPRPVTLASIDPVVRALRANMFNNVLWPDFSTIPPGAPVVQFRTLAENVAQPLAHLQVTPVAVHHTVPTVGFIVHDGAHGFAYSGDTGPTEALWRAVRTEPRIGAIILECAFPNRLENIAAFAQHMTPDRIRRELEKMPGTLPVWIFHLKPQFYEETAAELQRIDGDRVAILEQGRTYRL